jgi:AraC family transcriptional regulator
MCKCIQTSPPGHREQWQALLDEYGVGAPKSLRVVEVPGGVIQATVGEPSGRIALEGLPAGVLMFNISPVQRLRQTREGRSFISDILSGEMTLMPRGVPSEWSWNSSCDRLDVVVSPDILGVGTSLEVVDRYAFRDPEIEMVCRRLYHQLSSSIPTENLYVESLLANLGEMLLLRHSTASEPIKRQPSSGLSRNQTRRVLEYIEANLSNAVTLSRLSEVAGLSLHYFARMFKHTLVVTPYRYVVERRLERAKMMLRGTKATIVEVSLALGFDSQSHFTNTFRRMAGTTPAQFRSFFHRSAIRSTYNQRTVLNDRSIPPLLPHIDGL